MQPTLVLDNIITMDLRRPTAIASVVKNGVFAFIGDAHTLYNTHREFSNHA